MRHFSPLALIALSAIPLSAHDHWRDSRCVPNRHREWRREERSVGHGHARRHDLDAASSCGPFTGLFREGGARSR